MFRKNERYKQGDIFGVSSQLSKRQIKLWDKSREHKFFIEVFQKIDEGIFSCLYSTQKSRPNVSVNQMVGALILKHLNNWTYDCLFSNLNFNLLTRHALGIQSIDEDVFSPASIFNFQNKLINHFNSTGVDLISKVFDQLNQKYIDIFNVDTSIQRGDSFLIGSNIVDYTELRLLIELLVRFYKQLSEKEKSNFKELNRKYIENSSSQFVYKLDEQDLPKEIKALGNLYYRILKKYKRKYKDTESYQNMERAFKDRFKNKDRSGELTKIKATSNALLSPDDLHATYRYKAGNHHKGYVGHISETVNKHNKIDLITDVVVKPNNIGDEQILEERLPLMIKSTPELSEYHVDGAYASLAVDKLVKKNGIIIYQNNFRGRHSSSGIEITKGKVNYNVKCKGGQKVKAEITVDDQGKLLKGKAAFNYSICATCQFLETCKLKETGGKTTQKKKVYYFKEKQVLINERKIRSKNVPKEKQTLRANVEATVKEMKRGMKNRKVRIRNWKRISNHMVLTALAINFTRIAKYIAPKSCFEHTNTYKTWSKKIKITRLFIIQNAQKMHLAVECSF